MARGTFSCGAVLAIFFLFSPCYGVIYHLNESEYARMPPLYALDEYARCLVPADGTYCLLRVDLRAEAGNELMQLIQEYSASNIKHYNHSYLQRGVCVTRTCQGHIKNNSLHTTHGLTTILEGCLNESIYTEYGVQAGLVEINYCERKGEQLHIDIVDWVALGIFVSVVLINVVGTLYDAITSRMVRDTKGNKFLLSFSLIQNWRRLISKESEEIRVKRLTGLHGVRVLTIFLMFTSHVMWVNSMGFIDNIQDFEELYENAYYQMIFNGLVVVQLFLVMSGFLLVYNLEGYAEKGRVGWTLAPKIWFLRWIRLTPAYAILLAFHSTWLRHLGSGPLWRLFVADSVSGDCRRYWWAHLLYINNYIPDGHYCALHTWYIAVDSQVFSVGLLAYFLTRGGGGGGRRAVLAVLLALGAALPALHVWLRDLDAMVLMKPEFYRAFDNDTFLYMHAYGHNNLAAYVIGMAIGHLVFWMQRNKIDISNNKLYIALAWLVIPFVAASFYSGAVFYADGERLPLAVRMTYAALQRPVFGIVVGFGVIALAMQFKTVLRSFFECGVWLVPSRLSYSVYLLHIFPIHAYLGTKTQLAHASTFNLTIFHFGIIVLTYMLALPFCLMVESPLMRLVKAREPGQPREASEQTKF